MDTGHNYIEQYAQEVLLWTGTRSRSEILQCLKFQPKTNQFMFVSTEIPVDPTTVAMLQKAADPKRNNPLCLKELGDNSSQEKQP